jgi:hypothetical protein
MNFKYGHKAKYKCTVLIYSLLQIPLTSIPLVYALALLPSLPIRSPWYSCNNKSYLLLHLLFCFLILSAGWAFLGGCERLALPWAPYVHFSLPPVLWETVPRFRFSSVFSEMFCVTKQADFGRKAEGHLVIYHLSITSFLPCLVSLSMLLPWDWTLQKTISSKAAFGYWAKNNSQN